MELSVIGLGYIEGKIERTRDAQSLPDKLLSAMRKQFGGHAIGKE